MEQVNIAQMAGALLSVRGGDRGFGTFPPHGEPRDKTDAYAIQDAVIALINGDAIGWKVGCTSRLAQEMSSTDEPFFGRMFADTTHESGCTVTPGDVMAPIVEPEIAFRLGKDLTPDAAPHTTASVIECVDALIPAIEVVDCRYAQGWPIPILPTIADNGVHAVFATAPAITDWRDIDRPAIKMEAYVNGELATDGAGSNALDDPINGLVWLANDFAKRGRTIHAGEVITTGNTANAPIFAKPGDDVLVKFPGLGEIQLTFASP